MILKLFIAYIVYTTLIFFANTYLFKENYVDAIIKAVLSGVVFTGAYAFIIIRAKKYKEEKKG
jgi:uncharacterized MnhB-related membrane protein